MVRSLPTLGDRCRYPAYSRKRHVKLSSTNRRRLVQFGIRGILAATALIAIGIVTFGALKSRADAKAAAFLTIDQNGGIYGYTTGSSAIYRNTMMAAGVDERAFWETGYFQFRSHIDPLQYTTPFDDKRLQEIAGCFEHFPNLERLEFSDCEHISDVGIAAIPNLPKLELIDLTGTSVSENGVLLLQKRFPSTKIKR